MRELFGNKEKLLKIPGLRSNFPEIFSEFPLLRIDELLCFLSFFKIFWNNEKYCSCVNT